jgi:hypothetical protein
MATSYTLCIASWRLPATASNRGSGVNPRLPQVLQDAPPLTSSWSALENPFTMARRGSCRRPNGGHGGGCITIGDRVVAAATGAFEHFCVERLSYIFLCLLKTSAVSLKMPCASAQGEPMFVRMEIHSLSMPFISAIGL